jgi:hypothetical protein
MNLRTLTALIALSLAALLSHAEDDPLASWRSGVQIRPVDAGAQRHSIHSYFNTCPESPDGKWVLFYTSTTPDGHRGELRIRERATGTERVLVKDLNTEDAHRAACQQWASGGRRVVYHNERDGEWYVAVVDVESGAERVLAKDRLLCWGQPHADLVPIYGKHWNPGAHRDLELLNVATGEIRTVLTADAVKAAYPDWWAKSFGDKQGSIFFQELSPDLNRIYFKMSAPGDGNPRSGRASTRLGLVCYDLKAKRLLLQSNHWGHPAWHPDSRRIVNVGFSLLDTDTAKTERLAGLPPMGSGHPSMSPDGKLIVTDLVADLIGGKKSDWSIVVCDARGGNHVVLHTADNSQGAKSWRRSHPHPIFSADGRRIYFNVSSGPWTQLYVAECKDTKVAARP